MEMDTVFALGFKERQFLLSVPRGAVSAVLPLFDNN